MRGNVLRVGCVLAIAAGAWSSALHCAAAQMPAFYPQRPVRIIVPLTPGGGVDAAARIVADHLGNVLGQRFVVDNRPGAGGSIGVELVASSAKDGYTLLVSSASLVTNAAVQQQRYEPVRDFTAITKLTTNPYLLAVTSSLPANSVQELIALAKAKPGALTYASSGTGGVLHLGGELLCAITGAKMTHVPYKGVAEAYPAVASGDVSWILGSPISALPLIRAGRMRALAVTTATRSKALPELPTIAESGVPGFDVTAWFGMFAPSGVPQSIVARLHEESSKAIRAPELARRLAAEGTDVVGNTPREFALEVKAEFEKWRGLAQKVGLKVQ